MTNDVPALLKTLTVGKIAADPILARKVRDFLESIDYELVMPPDHPKVGDEFLSGGSQWLKVVDNSYASQPFGPTSYIVKRPSEHLKMSWFFFGHKNK